MPPYPVDPTVLAEARRLVSEDLNRDLGTVADMLAERGHHGSDGRPYPAARWPTCWTRTSCAGARTG